MNSGKVLLSHNPQKSAKVELSPLAPFPAEEFRTPMDAKCAHR